MTITTSLAGLDDALQMLEDCKQDTDGRLDELCRRLADMGAMNVSLSFARSIYTGDNDFSVSVEEPTTGVYQIVVSGQSVAFVEFGAGITYGYGHPWAANFGAGPGTYPNGKGHWDDPGGWYLPKDKAMSDGTNHTFGNPPNMPMYNTTQDLKDEIARVAREVFSA